MENTHQVAVGTFRLFQMIRGICNVLTNTHTRTTNLENRVSDLENQIGNIITVLEQQHQNNN